MALEVLGVLGLAPLPIVSVCFFRPYLCFHVYLLTVFWGPDPLGHPDLQLCSPRLWPCTWFNSTIHTDLRSSLAFICIIVNFPQPPKSSLPSCLQDPVPSLVLAWRTLKILSILVLNIVGLIPANPCLSRLSCRRWYLRLMALLVSGSFYCWLEFCLL